MQTDFHTVRTARPPAGREAAVVRPSHGVPKSGGLGLSLVCVVARSGMTGYRPAIENNLTVLGGSGRLGGFVDTDQSRA